MAKQTGPNFFTGRRGNLLGYRMAGRYFVRVISSLTANRVKKDPAFRLTMQYAGLLAKASKIASEVYRLLREQEHGFYRKLTGMAMRLLKTGKTGEETYQLLYQAYISSEPLMEVPKGESVSPDSFAEDLLKLLFSKKPEEQEIELKPLADPSPP